MRVSSDMGLVSAFAPRKQFLSRSERRHSRLQPGGKLARGRQLDDADALDVFVARDISQRSRRRYRIKVENAEGAAAGSGAAHGHLGDVHAVIAKNRADGA